MTKKAADYDQEYDAGFAAWQTDLPLDEYEEQGVTTDAFMDGWFYAKSQDKELQEDEALWSDNALDEFVST